MSVCSEFVTLGMNDTLYQANATLKKISAFVAPAQRSLYLQTAQNVAQQNKQADQVFEIKQWKNDATNITGNTAQQISQYDTVEFFGKQKTTLKYMVVTDFTQIKGKWYVWDQTVQKA